MPLIDASTARDYIPELTSTSQDSVINTIIARVETEFARLLGFPRNDAGAYTLDSSTYTVYVDGPAFFDADVCILPVRPCTAVASIHSDINRVYGSDTLIDASNYELDIEQGRVILKPNIATRVFDRSFRAIKVVCTAGFTSAPADLAHAICLQVALVYKNRSNIGIDSITQRQSTVKVKPIFVSKDIKRMLYPLRNADLLM